MKRNSLIALLLLVVASCSVEVSINEESQTQMGSHAVTVKPGSTFSESSSTEMNGETVYHYRTGDVTVLISNEELTVNDVVYGMLEEGDSILIDEGKVFINDIETEGIELTKEEILEKSPVKESETTLEGHRIVVVPGSLSASTLTILGKTTYTVGDTKVRISDNELFVNDESFGILNEDDSVRIEFGEVQILSE